MNNRLQEPLGKVIDLLVTRKYVELETLTNGVRLSAQEMARAISDYGHDLVSPPKEAFDLMNVVEIREATPRQWSITMPLWTQREGRSDLSIDVTLVVAEKGFRIELDDIHVL